MRAEKVDLGRYLRAVMLPGTVGQRGGLYTFNCPWCGDRRQRGWVAPKTWAAGCFNVGCEASPRAWGGFAEWVRRFGKFSTRAEAVWHLRTEYAGEDTFDDAAPVHQVIEDFCRIPEGPPLDVRSIIAAEALGFIERQWGLTYEDAQLWRLTACTHGRFAYRVIIPIEFKGVIVAFQARSYRNALPKYLTSKSGPKENPESDCGRSVGSVLFGLDHVAEGDTVVLVEGPGDAMRWTRDHRHDSERMRAVALLGMSLTPERAALLYAARPACVIVALDAEDATRESSTKTAVALQSIGLTVDTGTWIGAKDAGAGARLTARPFVLSPLEALTRAALKR
jgi:hypothetical protein